MVIKNLVYVLFVFLDILIITASLFLANLIARGHLHAETQLSWHTLPIMYVIRLMLFERYGLYRTLLKYAGFRFGTNIVKAVTFSSLITFIIVSYPFHSWPILLFAIDWLITVNLVGASRFLPRYFLERIRSNQEGKKLVLIYGAGDQGDAVVRTLLGKNSLYVPVGFIDDNRTKIGKKVHNIPILGSKKDLKDIIQEYHVDELIVAFADLPSHLLRELIKECRQLGIFCRIAPRFSDMMSNDIYIKNIDVADLLRRNPQDLDEVQIERFIKGKIVLITGAAGSIGSEIARQVLKLTPKRILLVDKSEYGLYKLEQELTDQNSEVRCGGRCRFVLMDICEPKAMDLLFKTEHPDLVLHAAAYKHVPLLEINPVSAIHNNVFSIIGLAELCSRYHVQKFVMISTDKAVRPSSVMGATKRICELYIQNYDLQSETEFIAVRFGNVLGSSGSVIPKFLKQIQKGGPVTVTHPEINRYFMLTSEAVQLTLQAASIGHGGEVFILNMGEPVKIREMAEDLIYLAGKEPYKDIDILFTGLRPGEKLYEELLLDESEKKTQYENITIGRMTRIDWAQLNTQIQHLLAVDYTTSKDVILQRIKNIVPEFTHLERAA